jgi:mannose-6-phosphate isomerase-like protein (cupin superfamily)
MKPVCHEVTVRLAPADAFELFTQGMGRWWPFAGHSCSGADGLTVEFEPRVGGRVTEVAKDGTRHPWGLLTAWQPPHGFEMTWHPAQPEAHATRLAVRFTPADGGCTVAIEHAGLEVRGPEVRRNYDEGWAIVLGCYAKEAER